MTENDFGLNIEEMTKAGLHFGHHVSKFYPAMKPYIFGVRNGIHIIDLEKTIPKFKEALAFISNLVRDGKIILFVGTKPHLKDLVKQTAIDCGCPFIVERWLGGLFTNFEVIRKRIEHLKKLRELRDSEDFDKYTKKEKAEIEEEIQELEEKFGGIENLEVLPDAVFIVDIKKDELAVKEARRKEIKIIAIVDTNTNPLLVDYPIPANDEAISSVAYILNKVKEVILSNKQVKNND